MPDFSVIIVSYNTSQLTDRCIGSIERSGDASECEIIVVDNNSSDDTTDIIRSKYPRIILLQNTDNLGFGAACNQGMVRAKGRYIVLLNSDAEIFEDTLSQVRSAFSELSAAGRVGIIGGRILNPDGSLQFSCGRFPTLVSTVIDIFKPPHHRRVQTEGYGNAHRSDWVTGAFFTIDRRLIDAGNMFDPNYFMYYEETDYCMQTLKSGWQTWYHPGPRIIHKEPHAIQSNRSERTECEIRRSHLYFFYKNRDRFSFFATFAASLIYLALRWLKGVLFSKFDRELIRRNRELIRTVWHSFIQLNRHGRIIR